MLTIAGTCCVTIVLLGKSVSGSTPISSDVSIIFKPLLGFRGIPMD